METLSLLGIAETGNKALGKFSLGMKQRLALARAMLTNPDLLILDEPINGLDFSVSEQEKRRKKRKPQSYGLS